MKKLIVASNNQHKIQEIKEILKGLPLKVVGLRECGIDIDIEENGSTFLENAEIKARAIYELCENEMVLSDDSGLVVDFLKGAPGIFSARYSGEHGNDIENNKKIIRELYGVKREDRKAKFVCAMVLIINKDLMIKVEEKVEGIIEEEYEVCKGFGYDPIFYVPELKSTFGQVDARVKNEISHRGRALKRIKEEIIKYI